jgi:flagellar basal body-associated protein FliL
MKQENTESEKEKNKWVKILLYILILLFLLAAETLISGNFYYTKKGLLKKMQECDSTVSEIIKIIPGTVEPSEITVKNTNGTETVYYMDSNFMFDYRIWKKCE